MNSCEIRESQWLAPGTVAARESVVTHVLMAGHPPPMDLPPQTDSPWQLQWMVDVDERWANNESSCALPILISGALTYHTYVMSVGAQWCVSISTPTVAGTLWTIQTDYIDDNTSIRTRPIRLICFTVRWVFHVAANPAELAWEGEMTTNVKL